MAITPKKFKELQQDNERLLERCNELEDLVVKQNKYIATFELQNWISNDYKKELLYKDKRILQLKAEIEELNRL
jgi:predicted RNase H-like nuclease (RuvC/YqgF family)